jgi:peroxiredoxin
LQLILPEIEAQGGSMVVISPQTVAKSKETAEDLGLSYPVLRDPGNRLGRRLGLVFKLRDDLQDIYRRGGYDLALINDDDSWELPAPATFIVDQEGRITWAFVDPNYMTRAEPRDVVAALKDLRKE